MTDTQEVVRSKEEFAHSFHVWRNENSMTKLFMESLSKDRHILLNQLLNLSTLNIPSQDKLLLLGGISDCLRMLVSIINLKAEDLFNE